MWKIDQWFGRQEDNPYATPHTAKDDHDESTKEESEYNPQINFHLIWEDIEEWETLLKKYTSQMQELLSCADNYPKQALVYVYAVGSRIQHARDRCALRINYLAHITPPGFTASHTTEAKILIDALTPIQEKLENFSNDIFEGESQDYRQSR